MMDDLPATRSPDPSQRQKKDALEAALVREAKAKSHKLINVLLPKSTTRALCHAGDQEDIALVTTLLANSVLPDFELHNRARPLIPKGNAAACFSHPTE